MSLFILGSVSRITSRIVHHIAKTSQFKTVTIGDLLPSYDYHHRFYRLQQELDESKSKLQLNLVRVNELNDVKAQGFDDVLCVTHDYYENATSKTKIMEVTAKAWRYRKYLYYASPMEYDHFGFSNPEANYAEAEKKVFEINPNATVIRSDVLDGTQTFASLKQSENANFKPKTVKSEQFAKVVCDAIASRLQGKRILLRGNEASTAISHDHRISQVEYKHAKQNISQLVSKYNGYTFKGYEANNTA